MRKPAWQFQYSVETDASRCFAWRHWTNIANWKDPPVEFELDGPFAPGSKLTSRMPGQEPWHSVIREVHTETAASIEMLLAEAVLRFDWRFDELSGGRTRITQELTLDGENAAAYADQVSIFEQTIPEGMKKLATVLAQAEADSRHAGWTG
jgi:hypothetical protein